ncbi:DUF2069 domain-containing protein [Thalassotalea maritima]|uniref:DUF2069 domain-containing protein n=1 Tax=Thalassotalea maritima TaxID=3242416 RepID=UPI0035289B29
MSTQRFSTETLRKIATYSYVALLAYMLAWLYWLAPSQSMSPTLTFVMFILPLLLPLKGIIQGKPYTFAWANFIIIFYMMYGLTTLWVAADERWIAVGQLLLTTITFFASAYYSKYRGQELGLKIPKLKDDLQQEAERHRDDK